MNDSLFVVSARRKKVISDYKKQCNNAYCKKTVVYEYHNNHTDCNHKHYKTQNTFHYIFTNKKLFIILYSLHIWLVIKILLFIC